MRLTNRLYAQHLGWMFKNHWHIQGRRTPKDTGAEAELVKRGITVKQISLDDLTKIKLPKWIGPNSTTHLEVSSEAKGEEGYILSDNNVVIEGLPQAQILTKTIIINGLPKKLEENYAKLQLSNISHKNAQNSILASCVFDSEQVKTPIIKIPERASYVLPRNYGISDFRKSRSVVSRLLFECEKMSGKSISSNRKIVHDANISATFNKDGDKFHLDFTIETLMSSKTPLQPIKSSYDDLIPDLYPISHTITIPTTNSLPRNSDFFYPLGEKSKFCNPHTILLHYSPLEVMNLHETPITTSQFHARTLFKAFATATARAKQLYGENEVLLPKPVLVQSIQTDGKTFHFGIFQLNTLNFNGVDGIKNYWFNMENIDLFKTCDYQLGKPTLTGYNEEVLKMLNIFYNNC